MLFRSAGAVSEQHAGAAVGPVEDAREGLRADHQRALVGAALQEIVGGRQRKDEAGADRLQVERRAMNQQVIDQRVIAIYFDKKRQVRRLANYGLQDGRIFDFISRSTPTSGQELSYLTPLFKLLSFN